MEAIFIVHLLYPNKHCAEITKVLHSKIVYLFAVFLFGSFTHLLDGRDLPLMHVPMIYTFQQENIIWLMLAFLSALSFLYSIKVYDIILLNGVMQVLGVYHIIF